MSIFSVSTCMLERPMGEKCYITGVLHRFMEQPYKVAVDNNGLILEVYSEKATNNPHIAHWLYLMTMNPSSFEPLGTIPDYIEKDSLDVFLYIAAKIPAKPILIVYSLSTLNEKFTLNKYSKITFGGKSIKVIDRDGAYDLLNNKKPANKTFIKGSIIAKNGSQIKNVRYEKN